MNSITTFFQGGGPVRAALHFLRKLLPALVLALGATGCAIQSEIVEMDDTLDSLVKRQKELDEEMSSVSEVAGRLYSLDLRVDSVEEILQKESKTVLQRDLVEALLATKKDRDNIERRLATMETYFVDRLSEYVEREQRLIKDVTDLRREGERWMESLSELGGEAEQLAVLKKQYEEIVAGVTRMNKDLVALQAEREREGQQVAQMLGETVTRFEGRDNELAQGLGALQTAQAELMNGSARMARMIELRLKENDAQFAAQFGALQQAQGESDQRVTTIEASLEQSRSAVQDTSQRSEEADSLIVDQVAALRTQQVASATALAEQMRETGEQLAVLTRDMALSDTQLAARLAEIHTTHSASTAALAEQADTLVRRMDDTGTQVTALSEQTGRIKEASNQAAEQIAALAQTQTEIASQSATGDEALAGQLRETGEQLAALTRETAKSDTQLAAQLAAVHTVQRETATTLIEQTDALAQRMDATGTQVTTLIEQTGRIEQAAKQTAEQVTVLAHAQQEIASQSATGDEALAGQVRETGEQLAALTRETAESDTRLAARLAEIRTAQSESTAALAGQADALALRIDEATHSLGSVAKKLEEAETLSADRLASVRKAHTESSERTGQAIADIGIQVAALQTAQTVGVAAAEQSVMQLQGRTDDSGRELEALRTELSVSQTLLSGLAERVDAVQVAQTQASARAEQALVKLEGQVSQGDPRLAEALMSIRSEGQVAAKIATENAQALERRVDESMGLLSSLQERLGAVEVQPLGSEKGRVQEIEARIEALSGELVKVDARAGEVADRVAALGDEQAVNATLVSGSVQNLNDLLATRDRGISEQLEAVRDAQRTSSNAASEQILALKAQVENTDAVSTELGQQLAALEHRIPAVATARSEGMAESVEAVSTLEGRVGDALERIGVLEADRGVTAESLSTLSQLSERISAIESTSSGVAALDERIARLESRDAALQQLAKVAGPEAGADTRPTVRDENFEQVANRLSRVEQGLNTLSDIPPAWGADLDKKVADLAGEFASLVEDQASKLSTLSGQMNSTSGGAAVNDLAQRVSALNSELADMISQQGGRIASLEKDAVTTVPDRSVAHLDRKLEAMGDTLTKGTDVLADSLAVLWERVVTLEAIQKVESNEIRKRMGVVSESFR